MARAGTEERGTILGPPHDAEAEEAVLGGIMHSNAKMAGVSTLLVPSSFYRAKNARVFSAMIELTRRNEPVDIVTLVSEMRRYGGFEGSDTYVAYLAGRVPTAANIMYYARIVAEKHTLRKLIDVGTQIVERANEPNFTSADIVEYIDRKRLELRGDTVPSGVHIGTAAIKSLESLELIAAAQKDRGYGLSTGLKHVDSALGRLWPGQVTYIAAPTGTGKSAFVWQIATHVAKTNPVAFFSLEMEEDELMFRHFAQVTRLTHAEVLSLKNVDEIIRAGQSCAHLNLMLYDVQNPKLENIGAWVRDLAIKNKGLVGLCVVDYLQLMERSAKNRNDALGVVTAGLKFLAKETGWHILCPSQLNREGQQMEDRKFRPHTRHLRDSGNIEQDADRIGFLWPTYNSDEETQGTVELLVRKSRGGRRGMTTLWFNGEKTLFSDDAPIQREPQDEMFGGVPF